MDQYKVEWTISPHLYIKPLRTATIAVLPFTNNRECDVDLQYLDRVEVNMEAIDGDVNTPPPGSPQTHPPNPPPQPAK